MSVIGQTAVAWYIKDMSAFGLYKRWVLFHGIVGVGYGAYKGITNELPAYPIDHWLINDSIRRSYPRLTRTVEYTIAYGALFWTQGVYGPITYADILYQKLN